MTKSQSANADKDAIKQAIQAVLRCQGHIYTLEEFATHFSLSAYTMTCFRGVVIPLAAMIKEAMYEAALECDTDAAEDAGTQFFEGGDCAAALIRSLAGAHITELETELDKSMYAKCALGILSRVAAHANAGLLLLGETRDSIDMDVRNASLAIPKDRRARRRAALKAVRQEAAHV